MMCSPPRTTIARTQTDADRRNFRPTAPQKRPKGSHQFLEQRTGIFPLFFKIQRRNIWKIRSTRDGADSLGAQMKMKNE
jgi:hypothetical protein